MEQGHIAYCRKEKEIAEMHTDLKNIKRVVMTGNGGEALIESVPRLSQNVHTLEKTVGDLKTGVHGFLRYQQTQEGQQEGRAQIRRRNRWVIGTLVTIALALLSTLVALVMRLG